MFSCPFEQVFCAPQHLYRVYNCDDDLSKGRPAILLVPQSLLSVPWELFFDHLTIRALCLMDVVRGMQPWGRTEIVTPSSRNADRIK